jgi:hypothetical protein
MPRPHAGPSPWRPPDRLPSRLIILATALIAAGLTREMRTYKVLVGGPLVGCGLAIWVIGIAAS